MDEELVKRAQCGDKSAREDILEQGKPFIAKTSSTICKRYLEWGVDEELSIALLAFNEAIDSYKVNENSSFTSFAHKVIHRRLVDYFRKESKEQHFSLLPIDYENNEFSKEEEEISISKFYENSKQEDLELTVDTYRSMLKKYGITFDKLVKSSPKHKDTRENLMEVAIYLSKDSELSSKLIKKRRLPVKELCKKTGYSRKVIESGRQYIIALYLILTEPELTPLKKFWLNC